RELRNWILRPSRDLDKLNRRQQMLADLLHESDLLGSLRQALKSICDIERAAGRLSQASGNARDLVALKNSLQHIPQLKAELQKLIERTNFGRSDSSVEASLPAALRAGVANLQAISLPPQEQVLRSLAELLQDEIHEMTALAAKLQAALAD